MSPGKSVPLTAVRKAANSGGSGMVKERGSPVTGCGNARWNACRKKRETVNLRADAPFPRGIFRDHPYTSSPTIGQPRWAQCTRTWWVRPVSSRNSRREKGPNVSSRR
jgi:hypothetical protein